MGILYYPLLYTVFGILDFMILILDFSVFGTIIGWFLNFLANVFYITLLFFKYGAKKAINKLIGLKDLDGKKINSKKFTRKMVRLFGGTFLPIHIISIYFDQIEEKEEKILKKQKQKEEVEKIKLEIEKEQMEALQMEQAAAEEEDEESEGGDENENENTSTKGDTWIQGSKSADLKTQNQNNETNFEALGGKTGLSNPDDYKEGQDDYSEFSMYEKLNRENEKKQIEQKQKIEIENQKRQRAEIEKNVSLRERMLNTSQRRFGKDTNESEKYK